MISERSAFPWRTTPAACRIPHSWKPASSTAPTRRSWRRCTRSSWTIRARSTLRGGRFSSRCTTTRTPCARRCAGRPGIAPIWRSRRRRKPRALLDGNWAGLSERLEQGDRKRAAGRLDAGRAAGGARQRARADDDPRLSHARASGGQSRSARHRSARAAAPSSIRRATASGRTISTGRSSSTACSGWRRATINEMLAILKRTYCGDRRRRVHAHHRSGREELDPGAHRRAGQGDRVHAGRQALDPEEADRRRELREVRAQAPSRHQALRPRRRRSHDPGAGADHQARRRARRRRDRARHGPSRAPERARRGDGQAVPGDLPRIPGRLGDARRRAGLGRREVSSGRLERSLVRRQQRAPVADGESEPSRNRQSGRARQGARQAGASARPGPRKARRCTICARA